MAQDTLFWEPPLPNNNHLIGYILYKAKMGAVIDTTAPINPEQWDSLSLPVTTGLINFTNWADLHYFNIVAVYTEGKSDFLNGWTRIFDLPVGNKNYSTVSKKNQKGFEIRKSPTGYTINFNQKNPFPSFFSIADVNGRLVLRCFSIKNVSIFFNTSKRSLAPGLYIATAEFPGGTVLSQPFLFTK
jgi:hypothetical protein